MKTSNNKGISIIEYSVLFIIIIAAFVVMRPYILHGIYGNWSKGGQAYGYGRQYDAQKSIECVFDEQSNQWYDHNCYEYYAYKCNGDTSCDENIIISNSCSASSCTQLNNGETL